MPSNLRLYRSSDNLRRVELLFQLGGGSFLLLLLFLPLLFTGCTNSEDEIHDYSRLDTEPVMEADSIDLQITQVGNVVVRVQAPVMRSFDSEEKKYDEFSRGIEVHSFDGDGTPSSSICSGYAIYQRSDKLWEVRQHVVAVNEQGDSIQTEQIFWDESQGRVYTNANVRIRTSSAVLFGKGLESDDRFINWEIKEPTGVIAVPSERSPESSVGLQKARL